MNKEGSDIINAVRKDINSRNKVIEKLYGDLSLKNAIGSFILKNGGNEDKVEDVFVFAIMTFIKQCYRPLFTLNKDVNAYLYSIAKYEWMRLSKKQRTMVSEDQRPELVDEITAEHLLIDRERHASLSIALNDLDPKCRDVLTMWANNLKMREIALKMAYKSEGMARKKKHECLNKLRVLIKGK